MVKITDMLLTPNPYSRPQRPIKIKGIVWHWVANPNSSAKGNRNFFENRKSGKSGYGSAHYIIDLNGSVIRCLNDNEMGYHVGSNTYTRDALNKLGSYPNGTTIGIECTHIDWDGNMTDETRKALIELTAQLAKKYDLTADNIWLHQEVVGWKDCHRFYVNNLAEFEKDKNAVAKILDGKPVSKPKPVSKDEIVLVEADRNGMYEIKNGDTLWSLSRAFDMTVEQLEKLNPKVDPKKLTVGQKIVIKKVEKKDCLHLPASEDSWRVYPLKASPVKGNECGFLNPKKFNGLKYEILDEYSQDVYVIQTEHFGKVKIYATTSIGAKFSSGSTPAPKPAPKPKPKPKPVHKHSFKKLGRAKGDVWSHSKADFSTSTRKVVVGHNARLEICCDDNGLYYTNKGWISCKYVEIIGDLDKYDLPSVTLRRGDKGGNVVRVQRALNQLYFKVGSEDGVFGARTQDALKRFQMVHDAYHVNGVYSSRVEKIMEKMLSK
jgi:N-acetylmuramoyl-L-alanine amidase